VEKLISYNYYQGNVAELEEALERALLIAEGGVISSEHIFLALWPKKRPGVKPAAPLSLCRTQCRRGSTRVIFRLPLRLYF
jgi:DNA-binding NtrC family response regulator